MGANKKIITCLLLTLAVVLIYPTTANAAWWNPLSWFGSDLSPAQIDRSEGLPKKTPESGIGTPVTTGTARIETEVPEVSPEPAAADTKQTKDPESQAKLETLVAENNSLKARLVVVKKELSNLQSDYASCKSSLAIKLSLPSTTVPPPAPIPQPVNKPSGAEQIDYSKYTKLDNTRSYAKNPLPYFGKPIMLKYGLIVGFGPAIDPASDNNYIHLVDYKGTPSDPGEIALRVDDVEDFSKITWQLKKGDLVNIYGLGARSVEFRIVGGEAGSYVAYKSVITLQRILKCGKDCDDIYFIFSK